MEDGEALSDVHRVGFLKYLLLRSTDSTDAIGSTGATGYPTVPVKRTAIGHETNVKRRRIDWDKIDSCPQQYAAEIIEAVGDDDLDVCKGAIRLVKQLLRHRPLTDDESIKFYDHLADDRLEIRHEMGGLVYDLFIAQNLSSQSGSKDVDSLVAVRGLLHIMREIPPDCPEFDVVIHAVWGHMAMRDCKCIISLLADESPQLELEEKDATYLIRLLDLSVRKEEKDEEEDEFEDEEEELGSVKRKRDITSAVMEVYPDLLLKFKADKENIIRLVQIILCVDLELFSSEDLGKMLEVTIDVFLAYGDDKHKDTDKDHSILTSYVNVIRFFMGRSREGAAWPSTLQKMIEKLGVRLVEQIRKAMTEHDGYLILLNMKRLYVLRCQGLHTGKINDRFLIKIAGLRDGLESSTILQVVTEAVKFAFIDPPEHLPFLLCGVVELVPGLSVPDVQTILRDVTEIIDNSMGTSLSIFNDMWNPYYEFFLELLKYCE